MFDQCDDPPNLLCLSTKQTKGPLNGFKQNKLRQKERVTSYKNSKIHTYLSRNHEFGQNWIYQKKQSLERDFSRQKNTNN